MVGAVVYRASRPVVAVHAKPSIAVLPFKDLARAMTKSTSPTDGRGDSHGLGSGTWDSGARRTSSFYFKGKDVRLEDIGRELKVDHVLEGSVRRSGSKVRVSAEVVKVGTGERVWSPSFDREFSDIFAVQDEIASTLRRCTADGADGDPVRLGCSLGGHELKAERPSWPSPTASATPPARRLRDPGVQAPLTFRPWRRVHSHRIPVARRSGCPQTVSAQRNDWGYGHPGPLAPTTHAARRGHYAAGWRQGRGVRPRTRSP